MFPSVPHCPKSTKSKVTSVPGPLPGAVPNYNGFGMNFFKNSSWGRHRTVLSAKPTQDQPYKFHFVLPSERRGRCSLRYCADPTPGESKPLPNSTSLGHSGHDSLVQVQNGVSQKSQIKLFHFPSVSNRWKMWNVTAGLENHLVKAPAGAELMNSMEILRKHPVKAFSPSRDP